ncbi:MAG: hypothetical protein F9K29_15005 [Hyphomicrobiaceae bacterium]|nr:MAG: hypothetical protein F9K29_15005 [Hyphomicrobiaceae bacterium]
MRARMLLLLGFAVSIETATGHAASPDQPGASVPEARYAPITGGTQSYRPVEPLPWGQVNRRVTPKEVQPVPRDGKAEPGPQTPTQRTQ